MEIKTSFVRLATRMPGVYYEPAAETPRGRVCVLVMHSDEDYLSCPTGPELARRGYRVLCANVMSKEGMFFHQPQKMHAVKAAVRWLRTRPELTRVVLMGHSGGATLMSAYECLAENGPGVFRGPEKILPYPDDEQLPPADGVMLLDANWGNAAMQLFSLDPAVTDEATGKKLDPALNLFNPENGFAVGGSHFSPAFIRRYQQAQGARNSRILAHALVRLHAIEAGEGLYADDEPLVIPGADQAFFNNKLYAQDVSLMAHTKRPHLLLHSGGRRSEEIVRSLRRPENDVCLTDRLVDGARMFTVRNYLTSYAVRTLPDYGYGADGVQGIDWASSWCCPPGSMAHVRVPLLVMGMTGSWEFLAAETICDMAASADKTIAFVEGASHKFTPAHACEAFPGQFGDTMAILHDFIAEWLERFTR